MLTSIAAVAIGAVALSACASQRTDDESAAPSDVDGTFVFAASAEPQGLDPAFAQDGETFRVTRQIFEGLVGTEPGTADPAPLLAESWTASDDSLSYTFELKEGVTFQDDTPFNAEAVCANFERWYNWEGLAASEALGYYYGKLFRGFASDPENAVFESCVPDDELTVTINLNQPFAGFIPALSLPSFAMQSPAAMEESGADDVGGTAEQPTLSEYATSNPVGTGPYEFSEWARGEQVTLVANDSYWGEAGQIDEIIFRIIDDPTARRQALESGAIDGYDLVAPADAAALEEDGFTIVSREAFNVLYLGFNQAVEELQDPTVRQALSYAIDKDALISQVLPEGTQAATQFMPDSVNGFNPDVTTYDYDPEQARALLEEAGYTEENPLTLTFNYPVNVSRPYMPDPERTFSTLSEQLREVGVVIEPQTDAWSPDYLERITSTADHGIHLLGWTGDYNDADNFVGVFFGGESSEWGFDNPELFDALREARGIADPAEQATAYAAINEQIAQFVPGVPLASPEPQLAFAERVQSYPSSPVQDEVFNAIVLSE